MSMPISKITTHTTTENNLKVTQSSLSQILVEMKRIELSSTGCKPVVLPLNDIPPKTSPCRRGLNASLFGIRGTSL